jgi:hypothetical protein
MATRRLVIPIVQGVVFVAASISCSSHDATIGRRNVQGAVQTVRAYDVPDASKRGWHAGNDRPL